MSINAVSTAQIPADVQKQGTDAINKYKTALGFEQMLAGQLVKEMVPQDSELGQGDYASQMQDVMTQALTSGRGLGIASQVYKEMQQS